MSSMEIKDLRKEYLLMQNEHKDIMSDFFLIVSHIIKVATSSLTPYVDIDDKRVKRIRKLMARHISGEPVQKVIGYSMFYDCIIPYSRHTLTPRMETELLVEKVLDEIKGKKSKILDMCSGSGCIGIAIAKHSDSRVVSADISKYAIKETKQNAKLNFVDIEVVQSDMFQNMKERFDIIVSNPPYIPDYEYQMLDKMVKKYDPKLALQADEDGLAYYKVIANEAYRYLNPNGKIFLEIGYNQGYKVKNLLQSNYQDIEVIQDYSGNDRIVVAKVKNENIEKDNKRR